LPVMCMVNGIRDLPMFVFNAVVGLIAGAAHVFRLRRPRHDGYAPTYVVAAAAVGVAAFGQCYSPQLFAPTAGVVLAVGYTLSLDRKRRLLPLWLTGFAMLLPSLLEWLGVTTPSQVMVGTLLCHVPRMTLLPQPSSVVPTVANLTCLTAGCYYAVRFRQVLTDMQRHASVTAWQLRQLVPKEVGHATVPPPPS